MITCNAPSATKKILIRSPNLDILKNEFKLTDGFIVYAQSGNEWFYYLKVPVMPAEYTRVIEGEKPRFTNTWSKTLYSPRLARVGFRISTAYTDVKLFSCIEYIAKISATTSYENYTAIQVLDYVRPETEDIRTGLVNNLEPYTTRYGMLNVDEGTGFFGFPTETQTNYYTENGFGFSFIEYNKRLIV